MSRNSQQGAYEPARRRRVQEDPTQLMGSAAADAFARRQAAQNASRAEVEARTEAEDASSGHGTPRPLRQGNRKMIIDWGQTSYWRTADSRTIPINEIENEHLYNLVNWAVGNCIRLYEHYERPTHVEVHAAKAWLRDQPLFRAVAQEAIKREFTFPADTFGYMKAYLVDNIQVDPWHDESQDHQIEKLKPFLDAPSQAKKSDHDGRSVRPLDLD